MWFLILAVAIVCTVIVILLEINPILPDKDDNDLSWQTIVMGIVVAIAAICWGYVVWNWK